MIFNALMDSTNQCYLFRIRFVGKVSVRNLFNFERIILQFMRGNAHFIVLNLFLLSIFVLHLFYIS